MNDIMTPADIRPLLVRPMRNLMAILKITTKHAKAKKIDESVFMHGRLAPDMYDFIQQIQYVCFLAIEIIGPLSGKKAPTLSYDEQTIADCLASLTKTIAYVESVTARDVARTQAKTITVFWDKKKSLKTKTYLERLGIPDFFFHVVTAYGILRHLGVPLRKDDFLGNIAS